MNNDLPLSGTRKTTQKVVTIIIHLICIFILIFLPEVIMNIGDTHHSTIPTGIYFKAVVYLSVFYINYFFIIEHCLNHKHPTWRLISINLVLLAIAMAVLFLIWEITVSGRPIHHSHTPSHIGGPPAIPGGDHHLPHRPPHHETGLFQPGDFHHFARSLTLYIRDVIILIFSISLSFAIKLTQRWMKIEQKQQALISSQREEELNNLKNQLNPHFLFNTLNSIYALIDICPNKAKHAVHELSHMLRYVIYENPASVTLKDELHFIESYISLMRLRLGEKIPLNITLDTGNSANSPIAPLIFISIIENVFKHGNTGDPSQTIDISITAKDGVVTCHTFNYFNSENMPKGNGIGLQNLKRRLTLIYGENAHFSFSVKDNTFTVSLHINLNKQS